ncbi:MAG: hypothetical protein ABI445_13805 [Polyangia bacterium]
MKNPCLLALAVALLPTAAHAQYNAAAGRSAPMASAPMDIRQKDGTVVRRMVDQKVPSDHYGNALGNQNDLARDGAFDGQTIAVIQLYDFPFEQPRAALKEKGFSVYRWVNKPPSAKELKASLEKSCELWIISGASRQLGPDHLAVIKAFFDAGHGVYIWGDNAPYYADANYVAQALVGTTMSGDVPGDQVMPLQLKLGHVGLMPNHLLSTGLEHLYEGITIATIAPNQTMKGLLYGSADNLVTAYYDANGHRAILDGGFTRLYNKWDTAGTGRYVKNAAAWLTNVERFGKQVSKQASR